MKSKKEVEAELEKIKAEDRVSHNQRELNAIEHTLYWLLANKGDPDYEELIPPSELYAVELPYQTMNGQVFEVGPGGIKDITDKVKRK